MRCPPGESCARTDRGTQRVPNLKDLANRISIDPTFLANARKLITPGTSMIVTDAPVNASTRSSSGFNILTSYAAR